MTALLAERSASVGRVVDVDAGALLTERAAVTGLSRRGDVSCGGSTRLLASPDGWFALSLARPDDRDLLPALLERDDVSGADWVAVQDHAARYGGVAVVERARLLGMPAAVLGEVAGTSIDAGSGLPVRAEPVLSVDAPRPAHRDGRDGGRALRVLDLSSLWAGPLCGALLGMTGAMVVKVESSAREDGARRGPSPFFDVLNAGKLGVTFDHRTSAGRARLEQLLDRADVVIDSSRPRALEQWGIDRQARLQRRAPQVWISITGHGRTHPQREWTAFGDDAAVAGGLVADDPGGPCFCGDAIADPLTGLVAAAAALDVLERGGAWTVDAALANVAAHFAGPTVRVPGTVDPAPPRARIANARPPRLGEHDHVIFDLLG